MEWKLPEERKKQYDNLLSSIRDLESTIGSTQYRIHKLMGMRADVDKTIKTWWDEVLKELNLDPKSDYMIGNDGSVQDVGNKKTETVKSSTVGTSVNDLA